MQIQGNNININKVALNPIQTRVAFKGQPADVVSISNRRMNTADAREYVMNLRTEDNKARFDEDEVLKFTELYEEGKMDLEPIDRFAKTTSFPMSSMIDLYSMKKGTKDAKFYDKVEKAMASIDEGNTPQVFKQSIYTPNKEFSIVVSADDVNEKTTNRFFIFDENGEKIAKKEFNKYDEDKDKRPVKTTTWVDLRTGEFHKKVIDKNSYILRYAISEKRDKDKNLLYTDEMKPSKVPGALNYTRTYPDGRVEKMSEASYDDKTGITTIKRNLVSSDGTRTEFLYEDDPQGNRLVDYKVTDKNGKVIVKNSQTFEKVSDNKFISSNFNDTYEITVNDKELAVKDMRRGFEEKINFKKTCKGEREEIIKLLKQVPGQELLDAAISLKKINGVSKDKVLKSFYRPTAKSINTGDDLYVFLHELGHAKDHSAQSFMDIMTGDNMLYKGNKEIRKTYQEEREKFNENATDIERSMISYFIQAKGHYQGEWGGLGEAIAETNALTSSKLSKEAAELGERNLVFQQHFPKTIAAIKDAMDFRNQIYAIEFYGT